MKSTHQSSKGKGQQNTLAHIRCVTTTKYQPPKNSTRLPCRLDTRDIKEHCYQSSNPKRKLQTCDCDCMQNSSHNTGSRTPTQSPPKETTHKNISPKCSLLRSKIPTWLAPQGAKQAISLQITWAKWDLLQKGFYSQIYKHAKFKKCEM